MTSTATSPADSNAPVNLSTPPDFTSSPSSPSRLPNHPRRTNSFTSDDGVVAPSQPRAPSTPPPMPTAVDLGFHLILDDDSAESRQLRAEILENIALRNALSENFSDTASFISDTSSLLSTPERPTITDMAWEDALDITSDRYDDDFDTATLVGAEPQPELPALLNQIDPVVLPPARPSSLHLKMKTLKEGVRQAVKHVKTACKKAFGLERAAPPMTLEEVDLRLQQQREEDFSSDAVTLMDYPVEVFRPAEAGVRTEARRAGGRLRMGGFKGFVRRVRYALVDAFDF
ncbi:hypothetical protein HDU96_011079 [Phlyctochytrium bullatum]|nr:hypothetical protein HDU96_011079 [Phlyctochytrium bullatum]